MVAVVPQSILDTNGNDCTPSRYSTQMVTVVPQSTLNTNGEDCAPVDTHHNDEDYTHIDTRHKWWRLYSSRHSTQMVKIALLLILDKHGNMETWKWLYSCRYSTQMAIQPGQKGCLQIKLDEYNIPFGCDPRMSRSLHVKEYVQLLLAHITLLWMDAGGAFL